MTKFIFYFSFILETPNEGAIQSKDVPTIHQAFLVEADFSQSKYKDFLDLYYQHYDELVLAIEEKYGIHDWATHPVPGVNALGYNTYEVQPKKVPELMEVWRQAFLVAFPGATVGPVCAMTDEQLETDGTVLQALEKLGQLKSLKPVALRA